MRVVALEEHFAPADLSNRIPAEVLQARGWSAGAGRPALAAAKAVLEEAGEQRLASMDRAGIAVQIVSMPGAGAELLMGDEGLALARAYNDRVHQLSREHPDRFGGFCHLPMADPEAAADELERGVSELGLLGALINGTSAGLFLDDPRFDPILARAARLSVPLYLHPSLPPKSVIDAYYQGLPGQAGFLLAGPGFGWHAETAIHLLRLVLAGMFERHPGLRIVIGHMGEGLAGMMDRLDEVFAAHAGQYLSAGIAETIRSHVWVTTSGFFSLAPFQLALAAFGVDRLLFSVDYPFASNERATQFLRGLPVSQEELAKIAHENADRLLGLTLPGDPGKTCALLTRRTIVAGLIALAFTGPAAAAKLQVIERRIAVPTPDGAAEAVFFRPAGEGRWPAVLFWPDLGIRRAYRDMARRLAGQGYVVLVPNIFYRSRRSTAPELDPADPSIHEMVTQYRAAITDGGAADDARAYFAFLDGRSQTDRARKAATIGYDLGAAYAFRAAAALPDRIAAVGSIYGVNVAAARSNSPHLLVPRTRASYYVAIARDHDAREPDDKTDIVRMIDSARLKGTVEVYPANRGWADPASGAYDAAAAERAFQALLKLLRISL